MLSQQSLEVCNAELFTYDVVQHGWEQEPNGFTANAYHTLTHLVKDGFGKDFNSPNLVATSIAPDNLMYALRIARWGLVLPKEIKYDMTSTILDVENFSAGSNITPAEWAHKAGTNAIADLLHEEDHASKQVQARKNRINKALTASRFLLHSAELHSEEFDFNLQSAVITRLGFLRKRFNIPEPN